MGTIDEEAIKFLSFESIPVTFVFSKADTLKTQSERVLRRREAAKRLKELGFDPDSAFWVSSQTKEGLKELVSEICRDSAPIESKEET